MTLVAVGPAVKRPVWILHVFVVGLALHNFAMAELYAAGVRGTALDVVSAWKEVLLALGLAARLARPRLVAALPPRARRLARARLRRARRRSTAIAAAALARRRRDPPRRRARRRATTCFRSPRTSSAAGST